MKLQTDGRRIVALVRDVFFGVRLKQLAGDLGYAIDIVADAETFHSSSSLPDTVLGIIDINAGPDWESIAAARANDNGPPILAFGPHLDVDGLRAARSAGVTRVVSNGTFHREAADLIERYAARSG